MIQRHVKPDDSPTTWCVSCGYSRNPYRHSKCPHCYVENREGFWLGCDRCGYDWLTEESPVGQRCPRCDAPSHTVAEVRTP